MRTRFTLRLPTIEEALVVPSAIILGAILAVGWIILVCDDPRRLLPAKK